MRQASEKQIALIEKLSKELGNDRPYSFATMTLEQASEIIQDLIDQKDELEFDDIYMGVDKWGN